MDEYNKTRQVLRQVNRFLDLAEQYEKDPTEENMKKLEDHMKKYEIDY